MGNKTSLMLQDEEIRQISDATGFSAQQIEKLYSRFTHLDRTNCGSLSKIDLLSIPELAINPLCDRLIEMFFGGGGHGLDDEEEERINFRQFTQVLAAFRTGHSLHGHGSQATNETTLGHSGDTGSRLAGRPKSVSANVASAPSVRLHTGQPVNGKRVHPHRNQSESRLTHNVHKSSGNNNSVGQDESAPAVVESLNDCLRDKLYFLFKIYDVDNDGRISFNDLKDILKLMVGNYIEDVQLDKIATRAFVEVDRDNDGFVEFGEFCRVFAGKDINDKLRVRFF